MGAQLQGLFSLSQTIQSIHKCHGLHLHCPGNETSSYHTDGLYPGWGHHFPLFILPTPPPSAPVGSQSNQSDPCKAKTSLGHAFTCPHLPE
jgi:hypothetical protein